MSISTLPPAPAGQRERLPATVAFAVLVHGMVILGVRFVPEALPSASASAIEVTLVRERSVTAPEQAEYLAQHASVGGGNTTEQVRPRAPLATAAPIALPGLEVGDEWLSATPGSAATHDPDSLAAMDQHRDLLHRVVTATRSTRELPSAARPVAGSDAPQLVVSHLMTLTADDTDPVSDINQRALAQAHALRERFIAVNSRESNYAEYLEQWRRRVERIGNAEYPAEARSRGLTGRLVMEIVLNADGTIRELALRRRSAQPLLDDAAYHAVRHAAPFLPFPPAIRADTDVLRFLYEWRYESGIATATMRSARAG